MDGDWITRSEAAAILECGLRRVENLIARGDLARRFPEKRPGRIPSLSRAEVLALRDRLIDEAAEAERRRAEREAERRAARRSPRPDDEHDWLTAAETARLLGITRPAVTKRMRRGTIPYTLSMTGRPWFRRDLIEQVVRARKARDRLTTSG